MVRLTQPTARKQLKQHPDITPGDYRRLLPKALDKAQDIWTETGHYGRPGADLVLALTEGAEVFKAVLASESERRLRLATFHMWSKEEMERALDVRRDRIRVVRTSRK